MGQTLLVKIILIIFARLGSFLSALFFYFLNTLNGKLTKLQTQIQKLYSEYDKLKQKYFQDAAGFSKIFVFKEDSKNINDRIAKRIQRLQDAYDKRTQP